MADTTWPLRPIDTAVDPPLPSPAVEADRGRRRRLVVGLLVAFLVASGLTGITGLGDWALRAHELDETLDRVERSEDAMSLPTRRLLAVQEQCAYSPDCDEAAVARAAQAALTPIVRTGDAVRDVKVAAWHPDIATFRDRYEDHSLAWQRYLQEVIDDPIGSLEAQNDITATFTVAAAAGLEAVPTVSRGDPKRRVDRIFASVLYD